MDRFNIFFENSAFWIIPAVALAAVLAKVLYRKASVFTESIRKTLTVLRFILLALLLILLISPVIKQIINNYEKPTVILAIDNSRSITETVDSTEVISRIKNLEELLDDKFQIQIRALDKPLGALEELRFNQLSTDLNNQLREVSNDFENRNLAAVVLISDGLYNQGLNPEYSQFTFPIFSVGLGDTTSHNDLSIYQLQYNKLSYQGNKIPIQVDIAYEGFKDKKAKITISNNGKNLIDKEISISGNKGVLTETFYLEAATKGLQRYTVELSSDVEERNILNNEKSAFIDIVEGKKKILIIAPYPHPDIKALEAAVTTNNNYEFITYIPVIDKRGATELMNQPMDLVIFHQLPYKTMTNDPVWKEFSSSDVAKWFITGTSVDFNLFNEINKTLRFNPMGGQTDNVTAWFNEEFSSYSLSADLKNIFNSLPPVKVPFGNFELQGNSRIFLYQQVGRVETNKPLFVLSSGDEIKEGVFLGDGLWQWRLYEYAQHQSHDRFNELIVKTVQYLSTREDKRKFRFYPVKNEFSEREQVIFESETYNDLYEPVYGQQINLEITDSEGTIKSFQYITSENNTRYSVSGLAPGVYSYRARTIYNNSRMEVTGEFAINPMDLENLQLTANFKLLRHLSQSTGGDFYLLDETEQLSEKLNSMDYKERIQTSEDFLPLINIKWIGILLILLASIEWITRKYQGAY